METITRKEFALAVAAGMERARDLLTSADMERLNMVVFYSTGFDTNYAPLGQEGIMSVGCPGSQANLPGRAAVDLTAARSPIQQFAFGFDDAIVTWWHDSGRMFDLLPNRIEIVS